jgi:adenosine deaminase
MNNIFSASCDTHLHLGAGVSLGVLWDIAHEMGTRLEYKDYFDFEKAMMVESKINHTEYLYKFKETHKIQSSPLAITRSIYAAISNAYREQKLKLLEIRFNPMKRNGMNREYDLESVFFHATMGLKKAKLAFPNIKVGLIIETDREFTSKQSIILAQKSLKFKEEGIVGFDMSGFTSSTFNIKYHQEAFLIAQNGGLGITIHAGEVDDVNIMTEIIDIISPNRVGHGIKCIKDERLMEAISRRNIILEICPTSNLKTGIVKDLKEFKKIFDILLNNKIKFTINSDGYVFLNSKVKDECEMLIKNNILSKENIEECQNNAFKYSFIN